MSGATPPVGEDDLHAYIDGQLPAPRRQAVEAHLAAAPQDARRVAAYRAQRQALRQAFAQAPADGPIPERLRLDTIIKERQHRQPRRWLIAASIVLAIGIGAAGGTLFRNLMAPGRNQLAMTLLEQEAVASHTVYAADRRHPVEVAGTERSHLEQWLSNRLSRSVSIPDLSRLGFHLIGGRLLATEHGGAAALFMYENDGGRRISVLLRPMASDLHTPLVTMGKDQAKVNAWIANGVGVAIVATLPADDLSRIAADIGQQMRSSG